MIALYLVAIVAANLLVVWFGPAVTILNAFLFIGLDLTARDRLHDRWRGEGLVWKMGLLIASGGLISYLLNRDAGPIALASTVAFAAAAVTDAVAYALIRNRQTDPDTKTAYYQRVNGSNIPSAAVDSLVFPTLAFGGFLPWVTLGQFAAKVLGGFVWSLILGRRRAAARTQGA